MATFEDDWLAFPHANALVERLVKLMAERLLPEPCFHGIIPGSDIAIDYVNDECSAMAFSRIADVFPATNFPQADSLASRNGIIRIASTIELGIFRGAVVPDNGEAPTAEEQYDVARLQMADMRAMLDTICLYADEMDLPVLIGQYQPLGPQGGVVGGSWTAVLPASA